MRTFDVTKLTQKQLNSSILAMAMNVFENCFGSKRDVVDAKFDATQRTQWHGFVQFDCDPFFVPPTEDEINEILSTTNNDEGIPEEYIRIGLTQPTRAAYEISITAIWGIDIKLTEWELVEGECQYGTDNSYRKSSRIIELKLHYNEDEVNPDLDKLVDIIEDGKFSTKLIVHVEDPYGSLSDYE